MYYYFLNEWLIVIGQVLRLWKEWDFIRWCLKFLSGYNLTTLWLTVPFFPNCLEYNFILYFILFSMMHTREPFLFSPWKTMCYTQRPRQLKIKSKLFPLSFNSAIKNSRGSVFFFFSPYKYRTAPKFLETTRVELSHKKVWKAAENLIRPLPWNPIKPVGASHF